MASIKLGIAIKEDSKNLTERSSQLFCLIAQIIPSGIAISQLKKIAQRFKIKVFFKAGIMTSMTF
jgi:hypothetical protein